MDLSNCYFLIPARKGSKGFPGKNRKLFECTVSKIPHEYRHRVYVSTDDAHIKEEAKRVKVNIIDRPPELAQDTSSMKEVLTHFVETMGIASTADIILLYLTYPERTWEDIIEIYTFFQGRPEQSLVCSEETNKHPYLCFYDIGEQKAKLVVDHKFYRRQDYPPCVIISLYLGCYRASIIPALHDLMFEENSLFYKLNRKRIDVDYKEDYIKMQMKELHIADERFTPGDLKIPFDPFVRHFERYFECIKLLGQTGRNQIWLDCACGSGYGTSFLTNFADHVVGYDIAPQAIAYANINYKTESTTFIDDIYSYETKFDNIFSVETIEHMPRPKAPKFLKQLGHLLKDEGSLIITTPIVPITNPNPTNKFHFVEYSNSDFEVLLLENGFVVVEKHFVKTTFTDGETKDQGYYRCEKIVQ